PGVRVRGATGLLSSVTLGALPPPGTRVEMRPTRADHKHAVAILGDAWVLKFYRALGEGVQPELEIGRFLASRPVPTPVPTAPLLAALEYRPQHGRSEPITIATVLGFVASEGT